MCSAQRSSQIWNVASGKERLLLPGLVNTQSGYCSANPHSSRGSFTPRDITGLCRYLPSVVFGVQTEFSLLAESFVPSHSRMEHLGPGVGTPGLSTLQATVSVVLKCGPQSGSTSITLALVRNANSAPLPSVESEAR